MDDSWRDGYDALNAILEAMAGDVMANMQLFVGLSQDNKQVTVELHMDGKPLGHIFLSPDAAEGHAENVLRYAKLIRETSKT
jgi:hypothetical protein